MTKRILTCKHVLQCSPSLKQPVITD